MSAGDLLLFSRKTTLQAFRKDPMGTTMTALIHLTTRSKFNHAALDIGDGMMVEATSKGVAVNPIRSSDEITVISLPAGERSTLLRQSEYACKPPLCVLHFYAGNDLEEVLAWNTARVGWKYGYLNAFMCGLRSVIPGLQIKVGRQAICSEIVAESLERAGHDWGKDSALVSPGDVAEHFGVPRR